MRTPPTSPSSALLLIVLALSLSACGTFSPPAPRPVQPPVLPAPPAALMEPPRSEPWSESVQRLLQRWQLLLTSSVPS